MALRYAVDTNILLRVYDPADSQHRVIQEALQRLTRAGIELCFTPQNIGEFWNVSTRPVGRNGFGLSIQEANAQVQSIERSMTLLPEDQTSYQNWRDLLLTYSVRGAEVHDAHIAAVLEVHGVGHLLTLNGKDFKRFPHVIPVHPRDVQ